MARKRELPSLFGEGLTRRIEKMVEDLFEEFAPFRGEIESASFLPALDIAEDEEKVIIKADVPGLTAKDIQVTIEDDVLTIKGEKKVEDEIKDKNFYISERRYGSFVRKITLPDYLDPTKTKASVKDGVLTIIIPKKEEAKPKSIQVKVEE